MKKLLCFTITFICVISLCACSQPAEVGAVKMWDCTITSAEETSENGYVISYSNEKIVSTTGALTLENRNDFDIVVHLVADGKERVEEIAAYGVTVLYQIVKDREYTLGCYADVPEGTEMNLFVYDGKGNIMHPGEENEVKSLTSTSGWSIQEIESLFLENANSDWKLVKCVSVSDFAYDRVGAILYTDSDTEYINIAFIDAEGFIQHCGIEAVLDENVEFTYHGNGEVTFNVCSKEDISYKQKITFSQNNEGVKFVSESME